MARQLVGILGLLIGLGLYQFALRFPPPWSSVVIGLYFAALGGAAISYAKGERWLQVLGIVLIVFGVARMFLSKLFL